MKASKYLLAVVVLLSAVAALSMNRELAERVIRLSNSVSDTLRRRAYDLNERELEIVQEHLREIERVIDRRGGGGERPLPPPDRGGREFLVRGTIERESFSFQVTTLEELSDQCSDFYNSRRVGPNVDEIEVSVNFGNSRRLYNSSSYWRSSHAVCNQIATAVRQAGLEEVSRRYRYIVSGDVENQAYLFKGQGLVDLNNQCESFYRTLNTTNVDEINVSVNFAPSVRKYNSSSYWRSSYEVCQQILSTIR